MSKTVSAQSGMKTFRQAKPMQGLAAIILSVLLIAAAPLSLVAVLLVGGQARDSKSWPSVSGQVTQSDVRVFTVGTVEKYKAEVRYIYVVNGRPYTGSRIRFMDTTGSSEQAQRKLIEPFPIQSQTTVYYDPDEPSSSVLIPGTGKARWLFYAIPLILAGIGVFLFLMQRSPYRPRDSR